MAEDYTQLESSIKQMWYPRYRATKAEYGEGDGKMTVIDWSAPDNKKFAMRLVFLGNTLTVSGPYGNAVFEYEDYVGLDQLADMPLDVLYNRMTCSSFIRYGDGYYNPKFVGIHVALGMMRDQLKRKSELDEIKESYQNGYNEGYADGVDHTLYEVCKELDITGGDIRAMKTGVDEKASIIAGRVREIYGKGEP